MSKLNERIFDEKNGLTYTLYGDYYLPDLLDEVQSIHLGRWGMMCMVHMEKHRPIAFNQMALAGTLDQYLASIDRQAQDRFDTLMDGYVRCWGINDELKAQDQMRWVGLMNMARHEAERNVLDEIVLV